MVECFVANEIVVGSSPIVSSTLCSCNSIGLEYQFTKLGCCRFESYQELHYACVVQLVEMLVLETRCWWFESTHRHHIGSLAQFWKSTCLTCKRSLGQDQQDPPFLGVGQSTRGSLARSQPGGFESHYLHQS